MLIDNSLMHKMLIVAHIVQHLVTSVVKYLLDSVVEIATGMIQGQIALVAISLLLIVVDIRLRRANSALDFMDMNRDVM